jgi:putative transposase
MASICLLQRLLQPIPRQQFEDSVQRLGVQRYVKSFTCWRHLVALVFAQLLGVDGLRQLVAGFKALSPTQRRGLDVGPLCRSTLNDANAQRPVQWLADVAASLMAQVQQRQRRTVDDARALVRVLDSSPFLLKGRWFDFWSAATRTGRTQGLKLHLMLQLHVHNPCWLSFTHCNVNDITEAVRHVRIERGATYVFDKGYCDYNWWHSIDEQGARFVTRFRSNAALVVEHEMAVPQDAARAGVLRDQAVRFAHKSPRGGHRNLYRGVLRRIYVHRPGHTRPLVLATNDMNAPAQEIAQLYKDRWQIELFFKWIKQHLRIRHFLGCSENAVKTQILAALITYLLLLLYQAANELQESVSLWTLLGQLRPKLLARAPAKPRRKPPKPPQALHTYEQLCLF